MFENFCEQSSEVFERFIKYYYDNQVDDEVSAIINSMLGSLLPFSFGDRNKEEKIKIVGLVKNLMDTNCKKNWNFFSTTVEVKIVVTAIRHLNGKD